LWGNGWTFHCFVLNRKCDGRGVAVFPKKDYQRGIDHVIFENKVLGMRKIWTRRLFSHHDELIIDTEHVTVFPDGNFTNSINFQPSNYQFTASIVSPEIMDASIISEQEETRDEYIADNIQESEYVNNNSSTALVAEEGSKGVQMSMKEYYDLTLKEIENSFGKVSHPYDLESTVSSLSSNLCFSI
jgi:hypothetical protein